MDEEVTDSVQETVSLDGGQKTTWLYSLDETAAWIEACWRDHTVYLTFEQYSLIYLYMQQSIYIAHLSKYLYNNIIESSIQYLN